MFDILSHSFSIADCHPYCTCELTRKSFLDLSLSFWTSIAYFVAVFAIYFQSKTKHFKLEFWTLVGTLLSISSMLFHSLYLRGTLALDYASIILALSFFSLYSLALQKTKKKLLIELGFFFLYFFLWFSFLYTTKAMRIGICVLIFMIAIYEVISEKSIRHRPRDYLLYSAVIILFISFGAFIVEETNFWCSQNFFSAHSFWHLGSALSLYLYGRWRFVI